MKTFSSHSDYSLVTAILPRQSTHRVLEEVLASGASHALTINARGTLMKERWYQSFLPTLSPEQEIIRFLVHNSEADHLMEQIVMVGKLRLYGAGSIYATPCCELTCADDYPLWRTGNYTFESVSFDIRFKKDLVALVQIAQKGEADVIARAAIKAGAQGPTISYIRGIGLRDRLGILRITKKPEKELIVVVVDKYDLEAVFEAMARAGQVGLPGRGFLYQVPLSKGLTNLASVFNPEKHSASVQQIIRAIDEMQGDTHWRANQLLIHDPKAVEFKRDTRGIIKDSVVFNVLCHRKDTEILLDNALSFGVPGASVSNWRCAESQAKQTKGGLRLNREFGNISMILSEEVIAPLQKSLKAAICKHEMKETCFFSYDAPIAKTFQLSTSISTRS
ncbi:MAG: hypothetical protein AAF558_00485 [Verrucomicrobiota bacterium]